jgi:hypothetical protein
MMCCAATVGSQTAVCGCQCTSDNTLHCAQVSNLQGVADTITQFRDLVNSQYTATFAQLAGIIGQIKTQVNNFLEPFKPIKCVT